MVGVFFVVVCPPIPRPQDYQRYPLRCLVCLARCLAAKTTRSSSTAVVSLGYALRRGRARYVLSVLRVCEGALKSYSNL